jgi:hypothetical protein
MDLEEDIKDFTARDIKQYEELTMTVRDHCLKMLENDKMPDHLKLAVELSIQQSDDDLKLLAKATTDRKAKIGEAAFQEELSARNEHSRQLDSEESDDQGES